MFPGGGGYGATIEKADFYKPVEKIMRRQAQGSVETFFNEQILRNNNWIIKATLVITGLLLILLIMVIKN